MAKNRSPQYLAKLIAYVVGRRPDEFGLVPDAEGCLKVKEVLKAITEEDGWGYVRRAHLDEVLLTVDDPGFEIVADRMRATGLQRPPADRRPAELPKLLYACVRRRAYPHVLAKGLAPGAHPQVVLSSSRDLAERIGRRSDSDPVLLTVQVAKAREERVEFSRVGEKIYLAGEIPAACLRGPALPKEKAAGKPAPETPGRRPPAGSFSVDIASVLNPGAPVPTSAGKPAPKGRKPRRRRERPPWRR